jgi:hypothetical protein
MGEKDIWGVLSTPNRKICGSSPREKIIGPFLVVFCVRFWRFFRHMAFANGFLILIKELGLLNNLGQWIRGWMSWDPICILYCKQ